VRRHRIELPGPCPDDVAGELGDNSRAGCQLIGYQKVGSRRRCPQMSPLTAPSHDLVLEVVKVVAWKHHRLQQQSRGGQP
jgi:hypothetical protein